MEITKKEVKRDDNIWQVVEIKSSKFNTVDIVIEVCEVKGNLMINISKKDDIYCSIQNKKRRIYL